MRSTLLVLFLFTLLLNSCKSENTKGYAIFSGQIVNPTATNIYLKKFGKVVDSSKVDDFNRFSFKINNPDDGLYEFSYNKESQLIYIEENDSILLHINTFNFDESIAFSGEGYKKNNFITSLYLQNELAEDFLVRNSALKPHLVSAKIEDQLNQNLAQIEKIASQVNLSKDYLKFAKKAAHLQYYDLKERFYFFISKYYPEKRKLFTKEYFSYREDLEFNDEEFQYYYTNIRLLDNYLKNKVFDICIKEHTEVLDCTKNNDFNNIELKANLLDSITGLPVLKDRFYNRFGKQGVLLSNDTITSQKTIKLLSNLGYNKDGIQELKNLLYLQKLFLPGSNMASVRIVDVDKNTSTLKEVINKPTILHSWNIDSYLHHSTNHKTIRNLSEKYPEVDFIGITTDYANFSEDPTSVNPWIKTIEEHNYNPEKEYHILTSPVASKLLKNYTNKVIFVDKQGTIVIGATLLNDSDFEQIILEFLNQ